MDITRLYLNAGLAGGNSAPIGSTNADFGANYVRSINVPSVDSDLTNKLYVDSEIATNKSYVDSEILTISLTPGDKGDKGDKGDTGENGLQGVQGVQGIDGLVGNLGPIGPQGYAGPEGPPGLQGQDGQQGLQGLQGIQGPAGTYDQEMNTTNDVMFNSLTTATIKNGGSISVPVNTTDSFVCRNTVDTLLNKTINAAVVTGNMNFQPINNILLNGAIGDNGSALGMEAGLMKWIPKRYGQLSSSGLYTSINLVAGAAETTINSTLLPGLVLTAINTTGVNPILSSLGFTIQDAGLYEINANINQKPGTDNAEVHFGLCKNGLPTAFQSLAERMSARYNNQTISCYVQLAVGDSIAMCYSTKNADVILTVQFMTMTIKRIV